MSSESGWSAWHSARPSSTFCTGGLSGGHLAGTIKALAELGVLILMFSIALEIQPRELMAVGRTALYAGVLGAAVPLGVSNFAMLYTDGASWTF